MTVNKCVLPLLKTNIKILEGMIHDKRSSSVTNEFKYMYIWINKMLLKQQACNAV